MRLRKHDQAATSTICKLCSLLLLYPDEELLGVRQELLADVAELPRSAAATALGRFCRWWTEQDSLALQQHYVELFDLDKSCGLYLTFYAEGDKRDRGLVLLRLKRLYRAAGLPLTEGELPDFLPAMLEFAAAGPGGQGEIVLREHRAALELLHDSLRDRDTPYQYVVDAVCLTLGDPSPADRAHAIKLAASGPPTEFVGLEPFGPPEIRPFTGAER